MNESRLRTVFQNYIEKFDFMNAPEPGGNETYKWEIAFDFRKRMDDILASPADTMAVKMRDLIGGTSNLLDNQWEWPGNALCEYCKTDPEDVRALLSDLITENGGDLYQQQKRIDSFIDGCEKLRAKNYPDSYRFEIGQRAAMVLLGLYDPEHNYLYKASQANAFADCVEFPEDWGSSKNFRLPVYYKMCDQLVAYMKADAALMAAHRKRYQNPVLPVHPDENLHLLAFDLIYCCTVYHLMDNISYTHISSVAKKQYLENRAIAEALADELSARETEMELFHEAAACFKPFLSEGSAVRHRVFGQGTVTAYTESEDGNYISVRFLSVGEKKLEAEMSVIKGFVAVDAPELSERIEKYRSLAQKSKKQLAEEIRSLERRLEPLTEYLE